MMGVGGENFIARGESEHEITVPFVKQEMTEPVPKKWLFFFSDALLLLSTL